MLQPSPHPGYFRAALKGTDMSPAEIKAIRERARLTQTELAALLRISDKRTVRRWETGEVPISGPASIILELLDKDELPNRYWMTP